MHVQGPLALPTGGGHFFLEKKWPKENFHNRNARFDLHPARRRFRCEGKAADDVNAVHPAPKPNPFDRSLPSRTATDGGGQDCAAALSSGGVSGPRAGHCFSSAPCEIVSRRVGKDAIEGVKFR